MSGYEVSGYHMPMGYHLQNGEINIQKEQAKTVEWIFKQYVNGKSMTVLSKELIANNILNKKGRVLWTHAAVGRILENKNYIEHERYPKIIEIELFKKAQELRSGKVKQLGRDVQPNSMKNKGIFTQKIWCGVCDGVYKKYAETTNTDLWKCENHLTNNKMNCTNGCYTDKEIEEISIKAINKILKDKGTLNRKQAPKPPIKTKELREIENHIQELEHQEISSVELKEMIFKRAEVTYSNSVVNDYKSNTEKMKLALEDKNEHKEFDEELFEYIVKGIRIFKDGKVDVIFINGYTITDIVEKKRKDDEHGNT